MSVSNNEASIEESVGHLTVFRTDGAAVRLGAMWSDRFVILALVRHFGCIFCKEQVSKLREIVSDIHAFGAELVIVGSGSPQMAGFFAEDYSITTPVLTDPQRSVYQALEVRRPPRLAFIDPRVFARGLRALLRGHRQHSDQMSERGDETQLGGVFIVRPDGTLAWASRSAFAGDHPTNAAILSALREAMRVRSV